MNKSSLFSWLLACLTLLTGYSTLAQTDLSKPVPFDPNTKKGTLPNGMTYYIRKNSEPKNRAQLLLATRVGSVLETDDENGLAHFTEHMAFNGTKKFPKNELVSFLQANGIKFGDDLNAFTSFDQTIYMLPVPTDSAAIFRRAFDVLEDWAHNQLMEEDEINKERGVILEELRGGKGAQQRMRDKYFPIIMNGSQYGKRNIIGTEDILKNFKPETIRTFYKTWYRPDLEAIIAVGDFDVAAVEKIIKEQFGAIPAAAGAKPRPDYEIPAHSDTKVSIVTDEEQPNTIIQTLYKHPKLIEKTLADTRQLVARTLFNSMLQNRLQDMTKTADPPFQFAFSNMGGFLGKYDAFQSFVVAKTGALEKGLKAVLDENARVQKFGFTATELDRAKQQLLTSTEKRFKEKDKTNSQQLAFEYVNNFVNGTSSMGIDAYYDFVKTALPAITLTDVNNVATQYITKDNRAVIVMGPEKDQTTMPSEAQLLGWIDNAGKDVTAYVDEVVTAPLLAKLPTGGKVATKKSIAELGVTELTLSNGLRVVLKPTDFKNDEILISAYSPGGTSLYPMSDYYNADFSNMLAMQGGVAGFSSNQLRKYLTGKVVSVSPYVGELSEGFQGSTSPKDLPTALQLLYAYVTQPRRDPEVVKGYLGNERDGLVQQEATPEPQQVFYDTLSAVLGGYNPRRMPLKSSDIDKISLDPSLKIYNERFGNASDFTYFFVGNFSVDSITPLLEKYLGALPGTGKKEAYKDLGIRTPKGKITKTIYRGIADKAQAQLVFSGDLPYTPENRVNLEALKEILNIKFIEEIREKESGVYFIGSQAEAQKQPAQQYKFSVGYGTNPGRVDELATKAMAIIEGIKQNGPDPKDLAKFKAESRRQLEVRMRENRYWIGALARSYELGEDPRLIMKGLSLIDGVSVASTKAMAQKVFGPNLIKVVLLPEVSSK
ncbi:M16 family metallopeptidase [Spirosoma aerolatum]|uniref:M16 family metallopeptidase n=1 Tax=Spirosoma aerolatum TaxID=1211326 RepID=UPI0009AED5C3|nr:M16 family metallopeptidase [Spirosoma aerolatum]